MAMVPRFFQDRGSSFFLFGPRGTGKTTWLQQSYPHALWVNLLAPEVLRSYSARPERLRHLVRGSREEQPMVVIDEIQKAPTLLDVVHELLESHRPRPRFVLTGSSARKLKRGHADLLAGRALLHAMHPFMAAELGPRFDLDQAMRLGMVPLVWDAEHPAEVLKTYVALYLREEVQLEGLVRNLGSFSRFLEAISYSHAAVLNVSDVARDCQVSRKTVEGYIEVLEDLLLAARLPVFTRRARRRMTVHPKLYWFDAGVFVSMRAKSVLDRPHEIAGAALEGLVAQHLRAWIDYSGGDSRLAFWRTKAGNEVDFVVWGPNGFWAIEVKHAATIRPADLRSLRSFRRDYPEAELRLVYRGNETLEIDGIRCVPADTYLREVVPHQPLP